ncbi:hypothetical protein PtA15_1A98 [Puccinia triticina]|nr:uncharacterized protein PtA15_1A98 [Puccinia triticina]WAQ80760.1 hypothetical protein PtA15_1A98 [Puccinia triticina]
MKSFRFLYPFLAVHVSMAALPVDEEWDQLVNDYLQGSVEFGLAPPENVGRSYVGEEVNPSKRGLDLENPKANVIFTPSPESESRCTEGVCSNPANALQASEGRVPKRARNGKSIMTREEERRDDLRPDVSRLHHDTKFHNLAQVNNKSPPCISEQGRLWRLGQADHSGIPTSHYPMTSSIKSRAHRMSRKPMPEKQQQDPRNKQHIANQNSGQGKYDQLKVPQIDLGGESWKQSELNSIGIPVNGLMETASISSQVVLDERELDQYQTPYKAAIKNIYQELHGSTDTKAKIQPQ